MQIAALRRQGGWTQAQLAKRAGTTQPYINRIESGRVNVTLETLLQLSAALNVSLSRLLEDAESAP